MPVCSGSDRGSTSKCSTMWIGSELGAVLSPSFTAALGFRSHADEGKVMGLAAYGDPGDVFSFIDLAGANGWPSYDHARMIKEISRIRPRQREESPINSYHEHIAARLQHSFEAVMARVGEVLSRPHRAHGLLPGGWLGAQLLKQRQAARPAARQSRLRATRRLGLRNRAGCGRLRTCPSGRERARGRSVRPRLLGTRSTTTTRSKQHSTGQESHTGTSTMSLPKPPDWSPRTRSSAGSRDEWRSVRALWAPEASLRTQ